MKTHKILNRDCKYDILRAFRLFNDGEAGKISFIASEASCQRIGLMEV